MALSLDERWPRTWTVCLLAAHLVLAVAVLAAAGTYVQRYGGVIHITQVAPFDGLPGASVPVHQVTGPLT
jgi:hypothetical protein